MLSNRESALLIWMAALIACCLIYPRRRENFRHVVCAAANPKIVVPFLALIAWTVIEVWLATRTMKWSAELSAGAIVWFITVGIVLFGRFDEASSGMYFFWRKAKETFAISALLEFYLDLYPFPLGIEIILQPAIAILAVIPILAQRNEGGDRLKSCSATSAALVGLGLLGFNTAHVVHDWAVIDKQGLFLELALPVWLTAGALPFIYLLAVYSAYEVVFTRLQFTDFGRSSPLRSRIALLIGLNWRLAAVAKIPIHYLDQIAGAPTLRAALVIIRDYMKERRLEERRLKEEHARLKRFADVSGMDAWGRQLDRREFRETTNALLWVGTCMMGWYHRNGRYRDDLMSILSGSFADYGLSDEHGIELVVALDGQAWYAWRRTISGWCFAIGADRSPPNQWRFDGPAPPCGFPGADSSWGDTPVSDQYSPNWGAL